MGTRFCASVFFWGSGQGNLLVTQASIQEKEIERKLKEIGRQE